MVLVDCEIESETGKGRAQRFGIGGFDSLGFGKFGAQGGEDGGPGIRVIVDQDNS